MPRATASARSRIRARILNTIREYDLIPPGVHIVAAVSGGADSLCLLHVLRDLRKTIGFHLSAATFDHGLRGVDSAADAEAVVALCARWGIDCHAGRAAVPLETRGTGLEAAARRARYEFLMSICQQIGADHVAVGHHADDQAETVLLRLLRGSSLTGIAGMTAAAPMPYGPHVRLIRPLLFVRRFDCESYCAAIGVTPREDVSNADRTLLRNQIRLEVLPRLRAINPQIESVLSSLAESAAVDDAFLDATLTNSTTDEQHIDSGIVLPRRSFRTLPPALRRRWIVSAARRLSSEDGAAPDHAHVRAADAVALRGGSGKSALLGDGLRLRVTPTSIVIERWLTEAGAGRSGEPG